MFRYRRCCFTVAHAERIRALSSALLGGVVGMTLFTLQRKDSLLTSCDGSDDSVNFQLSSSRKNSRPRLCGEWCSSANPETPCVMDERLMKCVGEYCNTTAGLWSLFILGPYSKKRPVTCDMYKNGVGYPIGGAPCDPSCLIDEIKKERYPQPTGLGVFCKPGTCIPGASPRAKCGEGLGTLECPCNWFGSECQDDWLRIQKLSKQRIGNLDHVTLTMDTETWIKVVRDSRPGSVIRINVKEKRDDNEDGIYELACAVSKCTIPGEVEIIVAPPSPSLRWEVRRVAELIRSFPEGDVDVSGDPIFVNPIISGFYNARYEYVMDHVEKSKRNKTLNMLVILSTGAGISGALSLIEDMVSRNKREDHALDIHLYYGLRDLKDLPYRERLEELVQLGLIKITLIESGEKKENQQLSPGSTNPPAGLREAYAQGELIKRNIQSSNGKGECDDKIYVQNTLEHDLSSPASARMYSLENTAFVVCGRLQVIDDVRELLSRCHQDVLEEGLFLNI